MFTSSIVIYTRIIRIQLYFVAMRVSPRSVRIQYVVHAIADIWMITTMEAVRQWPSSICGEISVNIG